MDEVTEFRLEDEFIQTASRHGPDTHQKHTQTHTHKTANSSDRVVKESCIISEQASGRSLHALPV